MAAVRYSKPTLRRRPDYVISTEKEYVSQTMMMKPNTTAYDPDYGVMKGTTKFMPQRAWNSVGHNNGNWSRQTADLVGHMSSPPAKKTNTPAFQPKYSGCAVISLFHFLIWVHQCLPYFFRPYTTTHAACDIHFAVPERLRC